MSGRVRGIVGSMMIHILIIVLLLLFNFSTPLPLPGEEGILINFGTDNEGMGLTEPRPAPRRETRPVSQPTSQKDKETPLTQDFEDAPAIPPTKPEPKPKPKPDKPKETQPAETTPKETQPQQEVEKPREIDRRTLFPGQKPDGDDTGEGDGNVKGNQGDPGGSVDSGDRTGGTGGRGGGISFSLGNRKSVSLPPPVYPKQKSGKVVVSITVDRNGKVTAAEAGFKGSTTLDEELLKVAKEAALSATFDVNPNAPAFQTGTITYIFKLEQ